MAWLDRSETECQPCEHFAPYEEGPYGATPHECFAPFDRERSVTCLGRVYFCANCNRDHHTGGYNACAGNYGCRFNHPACLARKP